MRQKPPKPRHIAARPAAIRAGVQNEPKRASKSATVCMQSMKKPKKIIANMTLTAKVFVCEFMGLGLCLCRALLPGTQDKARIVDQRKRRLCRYFASLARIGEFSGQTDMCPDCARYCVPVRERRKAWVYRVPCPLMSAYVSIRVTETYGETLVPHVRPGLS